MNTKLIKLAACLAWATAAASTATPASAIAITLQAGAFATCSASYTHEMGTTWCGGNAEGYAQYYTSYAQQIRFVNTGCNSGGTCAQNGTVHTDFVYATGRKPSTLQTWECPTNYNAYGLGSCAC